MSEDDVQNKVESVLMKYMVGTYNGEYDNFKHGYLPRLYYSKLKHLRDDIIKLIQETDKT